MIGAIGADPRTGTGGARQQTYEKNWKIRKWDPIKAKQFGTTQERENWAWKHSWTGTGGSRQ